MELPEFKHYICL